MRTDTSLFFFLVCFLLNQASADNAFSYTIEGFQYTEDQRFTAWPDQGAYRFFVNDVNGDGATDIIATGFTWKGAHVGSRGPQLGLILLNNGDNSFSVAEGDVPGTEEARGVLVADFNGDNISDIYIPDIGFDDHPFNGAKNSLLLGTGTDRYS